MSQKPRKIEDDDSEAEAQDDHEPRVLVAEGEEGAEQGERIEPRRGEHVDRGDGGRHAFADEPLDDGHRAAFAERKDDAGDHGGEDALGFRARQPVLDQAGGQEDVDQAGDDRAEQQKGRALQNDGEKGERDVGPRNARAGRGGGKIEGGEKHGLSAPVSACGDRRLSASSSGTGGVDRAGIMRPVKGLFLQRVEEADEEDADESEHGEENAEARCGATRDKRRPTGT